MMQGDGDMSGCKGMGKCHDARGWENVRIQGGGIM